MNVVVTGGAGFIGSHVVDALAETGARVLCIDSLDPGVHHNAPAYLRADVEYCFADLRHWRPDERFADTEAVIHLAALGGVARAAREPGNLVAANAAGTARLAAAAQQWSRLRHFVQISSFSIYGAGYQYRCPSCGHCQGAERHRAHLQEGRFEVVCTVCGGDGRVEPITTQATAQPLELYGASKYMQELCLRNLDPRVCQILRLSSVYGPRLRLDDGEATIIAKLAGAIRQGVQPRLFEDGRQLRDWVYVGDVVAAVLALLRQTGPALVNVCSGAGTSLLDACQMLRGLMGSKVEAVVEGGYRPGDMRHCIGDARTFAELLGRPPLTFGEGAQLTFGAGAAQTRAQSAAR